MAGPPGPAGQGASKIAFDAPANTPTSTILSLGGLSLRAACSAAGDMTVGARSTLDNGRLHVAGVADTGAFFTAATTDWAQALEQDARVARITQNVI